MGDHMAGVERDGRWGQRDSGGQLEGEPCQ